VMAVEERLDQSEFTREVHAPFGHACRDGGRTQRR